MLFSTVKECDTVPPYHRRVSDIMRDTEATSRRIVQAGPVCEGERWRYEGLVLAGGLVSRLGQGVLDTGCALEASS
jgi:hypothetical protein